MRIFSYQYYTLPLFVLVPTVSATNDSFGALRELLLTVRLQRRLPVHLFKLPRTLIDSYIIEINGGECVADFNNEISDDEVREPPSKKRRTTRTYAPVEAKLTPLGQKRKRSRPSKAQKSLIL